VLVAGIAEMAAVSMAMGLGGYLAARSEADSYSSEFAREHAEVRDVPNVEAQEVRDIFRGYGLEGDSLDSAVEAVRSSPATARHRTVDQSITLVNPLVEHIGYLHLHVGADAVFSSVTRDGDQHGHLWGLPWPISGTTPATYGYIAVARDNVLTPVVWTAQEQHAER
jgi:hypothetical protein